MAPQNQQYTGQLIGIPSLGHPNQEYQRIAQRVGQPVGEYLAQAKTGQFVTAGFVIDRIISPQGDDVSSHADNELHLQMGELVMTHVRGGSQSSGQSSTSQRETSSRSQSQSPQQSSSRESRSSESRPETQTGASTLTDLVSAAKESDLKNQRTLAENLVGFMSNPFDTVRGLVPSEDAFAVMMIWPESLRLSPSLYQTAIRRIVSDETNIPPELVFHTAFSSQQQGASQSRLVVVEAWTGASTEEGRGAFQNFQRRKVERELQAQDIPEAPVVAEGRLIGAAIPSTPMYSIQ